MAVVLILQSYVMAQSKRGIYQESWYNFGTTTIDAMKRLAPAHLLP